MKAFFGIFLLISCWSIHGMEIQAGDHVRICAGKNKGQIAVVENGFKQMFPGKKIVECINKPGVLLYLSDIPFKKLDAGTNIKNIASIVRVLFKDNPLVDESAIYYVQRSGCYFFVHKEWMQKINPFVHNDEKKDCTAQ